MLLSRRLVTAAPRWKLPERRGSPQPAVSVGQGRAGQVAVTVTLEPAVLEAPAANGAADLHGDLPGRLGAVRALWAASLLLPLGRAGVWSRRRWNLSPKRGFIVQLCRFTLALMAGVAARAVRLALSPNALLRCGKCGMSFYGSL